MAYFSPLDWLTRRNCHSWSSRRITLMSILMLPCWRVCIWTIALCQYQCRGWCQERSRTLVGRQLIRRLNTTYAVCTTMGSFPQCRMYYSTF